MNDVLLLAAMNALADGDTQSAADVFDMGDDPTELFSLMAAPKGDAGDQPATFRGGQ